MTPATPQTRAEWAAWLLAQGLPGPLVPKIVDRAQSALILSGPECADDAIPFGASKTGGLPDLPPGVAWPHRPPYANAEEMAARHRSAAARTIRQAAEPGFWATADQARSFAAEDLARADATGRPFPLAFMAQLDLAALANEPGFDRTLPDHGRLLVFYDWWLNPAPFEPRSSAGWQVLWDTSPVADLARHAAPEALAAVCNEDWTTIFPATRLAAETVLAFTPPPGWDVAQIDAGADGSLLRSVLDRLADMEGREDVPHQLAGWPHTLQHGLQRECQLAANGVYCGLSDNYKTPEAVALLPAAGQWRLVLQLGEELLGNGALYVMMREADVRDRAFGRAWVVYQCD